MTDTRAELWDLRTAAGELINISLLGMEGADTARSPEQIQDMLNGICANIGTLAAMMVHVFDALIEGVQSGPDD